MKLPKRDGVLKFEGCYHPQRLSACEEAGSGLTTLGIPDSLGVPADFAKHTLTAPYNDIRTVQRILRDRGKDLACIIVEPVAGNMGVVPPAPDFLPALRQLATDHDILLIFDEVISGFRVHYGGAQALYGVTPDLTVLRKIIGGGLPVRGLWRTKRHYGSHSAGWSVYQAGTLSGNPLAVTAGLATLSRNCAPRICTSSLRNGRPPWHEA